MTNPHNLGHNSMAYGGTSWPFADLLLGAHSSFAYGSGAWNCRYQFGTKPRSSVTAAQLSATALA